MNVPRLLLVLALTAAPSGLSAQAMDSVLSFESRDLSGWAGGPRATLSQDTAFVVEGRFAGRIERAPGEAPGDFSTFTYRIPRDFQGRRLVLSGWLRTEDVTGVGGLWLREDGPSGPVQFDNMADRGPTGTTEWTRYTVDLPLDDRTRTIYFGALLEGDGTMWVDGLELTVDGTAAAAASPFASPPLDLDHEFDGGSGIEVATLSASQVENLALLGRVWGFAKYHHPRVRLGEVNWDYELFRVLPSVIGARGPAEARGAITAWLDELGEVPRCQPCMRPAPDAVLDPDIGWITDRALLGDRLSEQLAALHLRRPFLERQYYVGIVDGIGNPDFSNEDDYPQWASPDAGYRLLALFRYWNIIEYWYPYRDVVPEDWDAVLAEFIPEIVRAETADGYRTTMMEIIARLHDTHANLWSHMGVQPPRGPAQLPVVLRFVEGQAVVTGYTHPELGPASGLRIGDVIRSIDGRPVSDLVAEWSPLYSASNEPTRLRDIARNLGRGEPGPARISGTRPEGDFQLAVERVAAGQLDLSVGRTHDLPGATFQRLSEEVAYLKLSSVSAADIPAYLEGAEDASVLLVDIRNYPSEFVVFLLGGHLVEASTEFARFTSGDLLNPGAFSLGGAVSLQPLSPYFPGRIAILVDETSQSQAEYTTMAFRSAPNAIVVGSTTAGADGNVSSIPLPGGLRSMISGIGVFYPDGTPTQQVGIVPDLEVRPTIAGIREGRDEVLEAGVSRLLGRTWRLGS